MGSAASLASGAELSDAAALAAATETIQKIIYDEQGALFMWDYKMLRGFSNKLRGLNFSPAGAFLYNPAEAAWWFPREETPGD